eukprot:6128410-Amphidinium_carterae.1
MPSIASGISKLPELLEVVRPTAASAGKPSTSRGSSAMSADIVAEHPWLEHVLSNSCVDLAASSLCSAEAHTCQRPASQWSEEEWERQFSDLEKSELLDSESNESNKLARVFEWILRKRVLLKWCSQNAQSTSGGYGV